MGTCGITPDIQGTNGDDWYYTDLVKEHFLRPKNFLVDEQSYDADGSGLVGSPACGDMMAVYIKVYKDEKGIERIKECKWQTFGCATAISSTSMMSVMATENGGMDLKKAKRLKPQEIVERLGGVPDRKFHCSVLGHEALRLAVENYEKSKGK